MEANNQVPTQNQDTALAVRSWRGVLPIHPAADLFPLLPEVELKELAADIKANGLVHAIVLDATGKILDGRGRLAACEMAGIKPHFNTYDGGNPTAFIVSANLRRRHLNENQRAMVATKIARLAHGGDRRSEQAANLQLEIPKASVAAAMLNISERSVALAVVVRKHGSPELIHDVEAGKVSVSAAAKQLRLPKPAKSSCSEQVDTTPLSEGRKKPARGVAPKDDALINFSERVLDLERRIGKHEPMRFVKTSVPVSGLAKVGKFLNDLASLKIEAAAASDARLDAATAAESGGAP
jgi:hypothetical protein